MSAISIPLLHCHNVTAFVKFTLYKEDADM